jgi:hypothetical protein
MIRFARKRMEDPRAPDFYVGGERKGGQFVSSPRVSVSDFGLQAIEGGELQARRELEIAIAMNTILWERLI